LCHLQRKAVTTNLPVKPREILQHVRNTAWIIRDHPNNKTCLLHQIWKERGPSSSKFDFEWGIETTLTLWVDVQDCWAVCLRTASAHGRLWPETMCSPMEWSVNSLTPVAACHIQPWARDPATYYLVNFLEVRISRTSGIFIQFTLPCFVLHRVNGWIVRFTPRTREPNQAGSIFMMRETKVT
jgi:hypothetical protein